MTDTNTTLSTTPFCCGVPGAVYSKIISNSFLSDSLSRTLFSPVLSHLIILDLMSCFKSFYAINNRFNLLIKKLFLYFVASSTNITQCCLPPMLGLLIDEMSKYILSPGCLLLSSFFFGIFSFLFSPMGN